jgi:restriction endonuclease Mrr
MKKIKGEIDTIRVFFDFKKNFDFRKSYDFREGLYSSIKRLYFKGKDSLDIYDIIDSQINLYRRKVDEEIENYNRFKSYLRFYWSEEYQSRLIGSACILPTDNDRQRKYKTELGNGFLLEDILSNLEPSAFEELCKMILKELGCQFIGKTRVTGDGGIDFFGTLKINEIKDNPLLRKFDIIPKAKIHFIGQAKRYRDLNVIHPNHIREFLGSALLLEFTQAWNIQKELSVENMPPQYLLPKDPTVWIFFTTSFATVNARNLANYLGIHLQDLEDISRWLALNLCSKCDPNRDSVASELNKWLYC